MIQRTWQDNEAKWRVQKEKNNSLMVTEENLHDKWEFGKVGLNMYTISSIHKWWWYELDPYLGKIE